MDHLNEAKKFIQRAQGATQPEVINQHLEMANWYLAEAIKERDEAPEQGNGTSGRSAKASR
jgi:hypothetical protein